MPSLIKLIVGGYFGVGKRSGLVSHFLIAVAEPVGFDKKPEVFHSLGRVGSGYTMSELHELCLKLKDKWQVMHSYCIGAELVIISSHRLK